MFATAFLMGAPTLKGTFLSGDDIQLVRDHVYVNHPSLDHACKLFTIVHRDLYQPVALLSLSIDFAIVKALGLQSPSADMPPGAWLFHLTNVILHGINAVLVLALSRRLFGQRPVAVIAALLFALHPLGMETVAWVNGRMMLLSTVFLLLSVVLLDTWRTDGGWWRVLLFLVAVALCMMSKVRICLPALLLIVPVYKGIMPHRRWWLAWSAAVVIVFVFGWINFQASSGMLDSGSEAFQGSRVARTVIALGWYCQHFIYPAGLAPFHPAPEIVNWSDSAVIKGLLITAIAIGIVIFSIKKTRIGWVGLLWFLAAVAVTLPLIPSRNLLVAERYSYLPSIGFLWIIAALFVFAGKFMRKVKSESFARVAGIFAGSALFIGMLAVSWQTSVYYNSDLNRISRVASVYPESPAIGTRLGWALFRAEDYSGAIERGFADLKRYGDKVAVDAYQLIGAAQFRLGKISEAEESLKKAIAADSEGMAYSRLGSIYAETGEKQKAIAAYEKFAELLPNQNPGLIKLAELYRDVGRNSDATRIYEQVLKNNSFDVHAIMGLATIEIAENKHQQALERLLALLEWMPENVPARVNVGLCLGALGKTEAAINQYQQALNLNPQTSLAVTNLAGLYIKKGDRQKAGELLAVYLGKNPDDLGPLDLACRNLLAVGNVRGAATLIIKAVEYAPKSTALRGRYAWIACVGQRWHLAKQQLDMVAATDENETWSRIAASVIALREERFTDAISITSDLLTQHKLDDVTLFEAFAAALEAQDTTGEPTCWVYYLMAMACKETGRMDAANLAVQAFKSCTSKPELHAKIDELLDK